MTGEVKYILEHAYIYPASHYVVDPAAMEPALQAISKELKERIEEFKSEEKLLEAQRISERTNFDIEMLRRQAFALESKIILGI